MRVCLCVVEGRRQSECAPPGQGVLRTCGPGGGVGRRRRLAVHLHVLAQAARVRVALVAAANLAVVRLVRRVHVRMLLPVGRVGEATVAALELALEGFLTWKQRTAKR